MEAGIVAADVAALYGVEKLSGSILLGGMPYRSMHPLIAHPVVLSLIPPLLSENVADFAKGCAEFPLSCVSTSFVMPEEVRLMSVGAIAIQVRLICFPFFPTFLLNFNYTICLLSREQNG